MMQSLRLQTSAILWYYETFSDVIRFTDVNLNDGIRDVLYNQRISKHVRIPDFYLTLGRITLVGETFLSQGKKQNKKKKKNKKKQDFLIWCAKTIYKKGKRKIQGVPQSQAAALPKQEEEEKTDKTKQAQIEQTYEKH